MSTSHPDPEAPIAPPADRIERRLATLDRRAEKYMARIQALEADGSMKSADAFVRLAREIRRIFILQVQLEQLPRDRPRTLPPRRGAPRPGRPRRP